MRNDQRVFLNVEKSRTGYRWLDRLNAAGAAMATAVAQQSGLPDIVARVLAGRGVEADDVDSFLAPSLRNLLPDPAVVTDMDAAAARITHAVTAGERVAIYGDYDVDGAASSALLYRFLAHQGNTARIYIPDRIFEGYGPNPEAVRTLRADGIDLIVTVDCGSASFEALEEAQRLGVDVVVLDHHEIDERLPPAAAVANPNRQDDLSGMGYLAAVGVTYLAVIAVNRMLRAAGWYGAQRAEPDLLNWLDLAALGTVCDLVPLAGLNRALVVKGLLAMARRGNRGLAALADVSRLGGPIKAHHLGFVLGPRINAGGRVGDAALGARLLSSEDAGECERIAAELDRLNRERQAMESVALDQAAAEVEAEIGDGEGPPVLVTANPGWHPGIVGLVASRLKDRFRRPAVAIAMQPNGVGTGSARSVVGFDIGRAVREAAGKGILVKGGGHPMAAGLTVDSGRMGDLRSFLTGAFEASTRLPEIHDLLIDGALTARGATVDLIERIERAGPFGSGHPEPVFALPNHRLAYVEETNNRHMRLRLASSDGASIKGIAFRAGGTELGGALMDARDRVCHFAGELSVDRWRGQATPSLRLLDIAAPEAV